MQKPWEDATHSLLFVACSGCLPRTTSPGTAPPTVGWTFWALPRWSLMKKNALQLDFWSHFFHWDSLFLDDSSLYQVDIKLASTTDPLSTWHTKTSLFFFSFLVKNVFLSWMQEISKLQNSLRQSADFLPLTVLEQNSFSSQRGSWEEQHKLADLQKKKKSPPHMCTSLNDF